jgi:hypothetical protein
MKTPLHAALVFFKTHRGIFVVLLFKKGIDREAPQYMYIFSLS